MGRVKRIMLLAILLSAASLSSLAAPSALQPGRSRPRTATQRLAEQGDADGPLSGSVWGFLAVNLRGDTLVCLNPQRRLVPASNLKLITTGAALLSLGENFRYSTTFATDAASVPAAPDSTLHGNLYIK